MARAAAMNLCATAARTVLRHGDFVDKNLLRSGAGYVAIDPILRIGDPCSEPACHPPATTILQRAGAVAGIWAWTGSERFAGLPSGLSCRPVRPGVMTSPT